MARGSGHSRPAVLRRPSTRVCACARPWHGRRESMRRCVRPHGALPVGAQGAAWQVNAQGPPCSAGGRAGRAPAVLSRPGAGRRADEGLRLVGESAGYAEIADAIEAVPGVVAHGLFVGVATSAVVATPDGPRILRRVRRSRRAQRRACAHALALASVRVGWHACRNAGRAARPPPGVPLAASLPLRLGRAWGRALALAWGGVGWCLGACGIWPGRGLQPAELSPADGGTQEEQSALRSG